MLLNRHHAGVLSKVTELQELESSSDVSASSSHANSICFSGNRDIPDEHQRLVLCQRTADSKYSPRVASCCYKLAEYIDESTMLRRGV